MGLSYFIVKWYYYFLTNRSQYVKVHKAVSDPKSISTGVCELPCPFYYLHQ